jgi:hypothetical protein
MSATERLVDKIVRIIFDLDIGVSMAGLRKNPLQTINMALSSVGAGRILSLDDPASLRRALGSLERLG